MKNWKKRFNGVADYIEHFPLIVAGKGGIVTSPFGRERRLGARLNHQDEWTRAEAGREAINFPIQSSAGALTNRTIIAVHSHLQGLILQGKLKPMDVRLINTVHDSIDYEVKENLVNWFVKVIKIFGEIPVLELENTSFRLDVGVGDNWTQAELGG